VGVDTNILDKEEAFQHKAFVMQQLELWFCKPGFMVNVDKTCAI
jgi:hypothetical protein